MEVEPASLSADVYHIEKIGGINGLWLWDLGIVTLAGTEDNPSKRLGNVEIFSAVANEIDVDSIKAEEPERQENVTVYMGDYTTYIPTSHGSATHVLSETEEPYRILQEDVVFNDEQHVVLEEDKHSGRKEKIAVSAEEFELDWKPVIEI